METKSETTKLQKELKMIEISPITRLEGEAKISIFLDDEGNVDDAYFQVIELRGFERFCIGRPVEELPRIVTRICGVCSWAHHMASTKALDDIYGIYPEGAAKKIRELGYYAHIIHSHLAHFYALAGPDIFLGPDADPVMRNIFGLYQTFKEITKDAIMNRIYAQKIQEMIGGTAVHPNCGIPGGVSAPLTKEKKEKIEKYSKSILEFTKKSVSLLQDTIEKRKDLSDLILGDVYYHRTYYMGLVDENNKLQLYDGDIRVVSPNGKEVAKFKGNEYLDYIGEHVEPWSYLKFPYLKFIGWKGITDGENSGVYRVNTLARFNVSDGFTTPLAQEAYDAMFEFIGEKPAHNTLAFNWARIIEALYASERIAELISDSEIMDKNVRPEVKEIANYRGVGVVEAPRGTLYHDYTVNEDGLITKLNLVVATVQNNPGMCMSIKKAAQKLIKNGEISEGILNRVEMAFRAYDPCLACATHSMIGRMPMEVTIYNSEKKAVKTLRRTL